MYSGSPGCTHNVRKESVFSALGKVNGHLAALVLCVVCAYEGDAASVTLAWNPSPSGDVAGYNVCYGPTAHNYTNVVDVGASTTFSLFGLVVGATYCIAVTAYNNLGVESLPSDEVVYTVPDGSYGPKFENTSLTMNNGSFNFALGADPGQEVIIQASTDLVHWIPISTNTVSGTTLNFTDPGATNLIRVFRALLNSGGAPQPVPIVLQVPNASGLPNPLAK